MHHQSSERHYDHKEMCSAEITVPERILYKGGAHSFLYDLGDPALKTIQQVNKLNLCTVCYNFKKFNSDPTCVGLDIMWLQGVGNCVYMRNVDIGSVKYLMIGW